MIEKLSLLDLLFERVVIGGAGAAETDEPWVDRGEHIGIVHGQQTLPEGGDHGGIEFLGGHPRVIGAAQLGQDLQGRPSVAQQTRDLLPVSRPGLIPACPHGVDHRFAEQVRSRGKIAGLQAARH
jgi:hypothetical protein